MPTREDEIKIGYGTEENGFFIGEDKIGDFMEVDGTKREIDMEEVKELADNDENVKKVLEKAQEIELSMPQFVLDMRELGNGYKEVEKE